MQVIKSVSSFAEVLRDLRGCGSLALPVAVVPDFVKFCNRLQVFPCGGAVVQGFDGSMLQYLYL